jgi:hypothetical protein
MNLMVRSPSKAPIKSNPADVGEYLPKGEGSQALGALAAQSIRL